MQPLSQPPIHSDSESLAIETVVLGHSLVCSLVRSHRSLTHSLLSSRDSGMFMSGFSKCSGSLCSVHPLSQITEQHCHSPLPYLHAVLPSSSIRLPIGPSGLADWLSSNPRVDSLAIENRSSDPVGGLRTEGRRSVVLKRKKNVYIQ